MENARIKNLPIAGKIQHGEQQIDGKIKKVKELGYFKAKVDNSFMEYLSNRFLEKYPKEKKLKVRFVDENPLSVRNTRYNQGGTVCYCMENETKAKRKTSNKWETIECTENCEHRKIEEGSSKPACNREGRLFFMLPEISSDRIWYMLIRSQKSINRLKDYLEFQKQIGNSLVGDFILYLTQEPQTTKTGKIFNNYVLGIYKEDLDSNQTIPQIEDNKKQENKISNEIIVDKPKENIKEEVSKVKEQKTVTKTSNKTETENKVEDKKKKQKDKTKESKNKVETKTTEQSNTSKQNKDEASMNNIYALIGTTKTKIMNKNELKEYVVGNFFDSEDKPIDVIVPHEYAEELTNCDLGTMVELDIKKAGDKLFTNSIKYIQKYIKNVAA